MRQYKNLITAFVRSWNYVHGETLEILSSLDDKKLQFKPQGEKWQPLFYQFGCILRTQRVYTRAIIEGRMDYSWFHDPILMEKTGCQTKKELQVEMEKINKEWIAAIRNKREEEDFKIKWPGFNMGLAEHITALISHERLHHGQTISYFTWANFELPKNFKDNWSL